MSDHLLLDIRADRKSQGRRFFVSISNETDVYVNVETLAEWSSLSIRTIRDHLKDPANPIPHYKLNGRVLVHWGEFKAWMQTFRAAASDIDGILKLKSKA